MSKRLQIAALIFIVALGFALRIGGLGRVGFNEDEVHKVEAARSYLRGNFSVNRELTRLGGLLEPRTGTLPPGPRGSRRPSAQRYLWFADGDRDFPFGPGIL